MDLLAPNKETGSITVLNTDQGMKVLERRNSLDTMISNMKKDIESYKEQIMILKEENSKITVYVDYDKNIRIDREWRAISGSS